MVLEGRAKRTAKLNLLSGCTGCCSVTGQTVAVKKIRMGRRIDGIGMAAIREIHLLRERLLHGTHVPNACPPSAGSAHSLPEHRMPPIGHVQMASAPSRVGADHRVRRTA